MNEEVLPAFARHLLFLFRGELTNVAEFEVSNITHHYIELQDAPFPWDRFLPLLTKTILPRGILSQTQWSTSDLIVDDFVKKFGLYSEATQTPGTYSNWIKYNEFLSKRINPLSRIITNDQQTFIDESQMMTPELLDGLIRLIDPDNQDFTVGNYFGYFVIMDLKLYFENNLIQTIPVEIASWYDSSHDIHIKYAFQIRANVDLEFDEFRLSSTFWDMFIKKLDTAQQVKEGTTIGGTFKLQIYNKQTIF